MRVLGYASRTLTPAEKNYHMHAGKLEFLALKWAITEKFRDYLYYAPSFTVYTDNNPLTYILSSAKLSVVGHRWVAELADFNFNIKYRPGKINIDADVLSRIPIDLDKYMKDCTAEMEKDAICATIQAVLYQGEATPWVTAVSASINVAHSEPAVTDLVLDSSPQTKYKELKGKILILRGSWHTRNEDIPHREENGGMKTVSHLVT